MNASELKYNVENSGKEPYFFSREAMKFFGDRMSNYGVRSCVIEGVEAWELYRKKPVKHGLSDSAYFDKSTFKRIFKEGK